MKVNEQKKLETYPFKIVKGKNGKIKKSFQAGVATLLEGQLNYSLHLYMLQNEEFFLVPHKKDPERYFIMTRQPTKNPYKRAKYSWNIPAIKAYMNSLQDGVTIKY